MNVTAEIRTPDTAFKDVEPDASTMEEGEEEEEIY